MKSIMPLSYCLVLLILISMAQSRTVVAQEPESKSLEWSSWRGPDSTGTASNSTPPTAWNEKENVAWKTKIEGLGHSSPIVWKNQVFVTSAIPIGEVFEPRADNRPGSHDNLKVKQKHRFVVLAVDRATGKINWRKTVHETVPHEGGHYSASLASASPVTDGNYLIASFGSHGIYCLDLKGNLVWEKQLGKMHSKHGHGEGASPVLHQSSVVINWDHEEQSFIAAFDVKTGAEIWKIPRDEVTSWSSPIVYEHEKRSQLIVAGSNRVRGYDLNDGTTIWQCGGLSNNVVATPIAHDGMVYVASSYDTKAMLAIKLDGAKGDITDTPNVVWTRHTHTPYVPSPLLHQEKLYFLRHYQNVLTQVAAKTGEQLAQFRLTGLREIYASPVAAGDFVYVTGRSGRTFVIDVRDVPKLRSVNSLDDRFNASAAISGKQMFLRGEQYLYCLADPTQANPPKPTIKKP